MVIQEIMAPDIMPGIMTGIVTLKKVGIALYPRLCEASSMLMLICRRIAALERTVNGMRLITKAIIIIAGVPLSTSGGVLKVMRKINPKTVPGITKGNIIAISKNRDTILFFLAVIYANKVPNKMTIAMAISPYLKVLAIELSDLLNTAT